MELEVAWRSFNAVLGVTAFVWLLLRVNAKWSRLTAEDRAGRAVLMLFAFAVAYGSGENIAQGNPIGLRTFLVTLATGALLLHLGMLTYKERQSR